MKFIWKKLFMIFNSGLIVSLFCFGQEKPSRVAKANQLPSASSSSAAGLPVSGGKPIVMEDFVIGPGDVLNIYVWKEQDLSKSIPVRPDGRISLPLINDVQASGFTVIQLKGIITDKLKDFITDPNVTVTVETVNSQKVTIMGEVTKAGAIPLTGPLRIMDVLATTGFSPFAKKSKIYLLRTVEGKSERFPFNYKDFIKGKNSQQNILLKNGDAIIVP